MQLKKLNIHHVIEHGTVEKAMLSGELETVRIGTSSDIAAYVLERRLTFRTNYGMIHHGYYVDSEGNAYIPYEKGQVYGRYEGRAHDVNITLGGWTRSGRGNVNMAIYEPLTPCDALGGFHGPIFDKWTLVEWYPGRDTTSKHFDKLSDVLAYAIEQYGADVRMGLSGINCNGNLREIHRFILAFEGTHG